MIRENITTENTEFVILSFEGPDRYSLAGGLGVRVSHLSQTLARMGYPVHLIFIGDPKLSDTDVSCNGNLTYHRWCQWIGEYYPDGVYHGEDAKLYDFNESVPWFIHEHIVKPADAQGKMVMILGEEWHTAETMCRISDRLYANNLRKNAVMFWNANNTFSFHRINWGRLAYTTTITTVSKYMKQIMWGMGLNPLVIPNGVPISLLQKADDKSVNKLKKNLDCDLTLCKVARWDPDKRWNMTIEATARLKYKGIRTKLLARGGMETHGEEVLHNARCLGLTVEDVWTDGHSMDDYLQALGQHSEADVLNIRFHCPLDMLQVMYSASDAVLANSGHEPFGLVGLEAMASGAVAIVGCTGEDYATPLHNAIVLETSDPGEIESYLMYLDSHPAVKERIRKNARETARLFIWEEAVNNLVQKLEYQARIQGLLVAPRRIPVAEPKTSVLQQIATWPSELQDAVTNREFVLEGSV